MDNTFIPMTETQDEMWANGRLSDSTGSYVNKERSEGSIGWEIYPRIIGYFLKSLFWSVSTTWTDPYTHTFSVLHSNTHQTMTIATANPSWDYSHPLVSIDWFTISASAWEKIRVTLNLKGDKWVTADHTVSFTTEKPFISTDMKLYLATTEAWLDTADAVCINSFDLSRSNSLEEIVCMSQKTPKDFAISNIVIEGSMEMYFDNDVHRTKALNNDHEAMRIEIIDWDVDLWGWVNPELTFDIPLFSYKQWTPAYTAESVVKQTVGFKVHDNGVKYIEAKLVNDKDTY